MSLQRCVLVVAILIQSTAVRAQSPDPSVLLRAYPEALAAINGNSLLWRDGTTMPLSDGHDAKPFAEQIRDGSILDMLRQPYRSSVDSPEPDDDPGRVRNGAFFAKMYGDCHRGEVEPHLVPVRWIASSWGHVVRVTSVNGVADKLDAVSHEIDAMPPEIRRFAFPAGGTYVCRDVADTHRPSMHGTGAAIDINVGYSDYWLWRRGAEYRNRIPPEIVSAFEKHGFIWGGRWSHYDTMHFEYRPELLISDR